ncbi:MAG: zinc-binding dehydrogenase [Pseudomonadota bacterium]
MQSWWMMMTGTDTVLEQRDVARPDPGPQQLLVKVHAASLNRGEFVAGHGLTKAGAWKAIGGEGAGEVVAVGTDVTRFKPGDRVMARTGGAFAEYMLMDEPDAMLVPANVSWQEAACIPMAYLVAYDMVVLQGKLAAGQWLLVNGVTSGVGVASLQIAKVLGAKVFGTSGSQDKLARLTPLGLDVGLRSRGADFGAAVLEATGGKGANLAVNTVGGTVFAEDMRCLAFEGRLAMVGYVDGELHADIDLELLHGKRLTLFGVSNKLRSKAQKAAAIPRFVADILPAFADGRIRPQIDRVVPFAELPAAKQVMESGGHVGKIVLQISA